MTEKLVVEVLVTPETWDHTSEDDVKRWVLWALLEAKAKKRDTTSRVLIEKVRIVGVSVPEQDSIATNDLMHRKQKFKEAVMRAAEEWL